MIEKERIEGFRGLFESRRDVYAIQYEKADGEVGYRPAKSKDGKYLPPTIETYLNHLMGSEPMGVYLPVPQGTDSPLTPLVCLDLDRDKFPTEKIMRAALFHLVEVCRINEVPVYVEVSRRGKGYHLWVFFETPVEAQKVRKMAARLAEIARVDRATCKICPKQDWLDETRHELGNLISLPLDGWGTRSQVSCRVQEKAQK